MNYIFIGSCVIFMILLSALTYELSELKELLKDVYQQQCDIAVDVSRILEDQKVYYGALYENVDQNREDILALMHAYDCFTQDAIRILSSGTEEGSGHE